MLLNRLSAELILKNTLGAAVLIIAGLSFANNWQLSLIAVIISVSANLLSEFYTLSCRRVGSPTGFAGMICTIATLGGLLYLLYGAVCFNWIVAVAAVIGLIIAIILPAIAEMGDAKPL